MIFLNKALKIYLINKELLNKTKRQKMVLNKVIHHSIWHSWAKKYEAILYIFIKKLDACVYLSTDHTQVLSMTKDLNTKPPIFKKIYKWSGSR